MLQSKQVRHLLLQPEAALLTPEPSEVSISHHFAVLAQLIPYFTSRLPRSPAMRRTMQDRSCNGEASQHEGKTVQQAQSAGQHSTYGSHAVVPRILHAGKTRWEFEYRQHARPSISVEQSEKKC